MAELQGRKVDKRHYADYASRAQQLLNAAERSFENAEWDACAINSIQSAISTSDALCTFRLAQRNANQRHEDAIKLFKSIGPQDEAIQENARRLSRILGAKNASAYEEKPVSSREAEYLLVEARRLFDFVRSRLPQIRQVVEF